MFLEKLEHFLDTGFELISLRRSFPYNYVDISWIFSSESVGRGLFHLNFESKTRITWKWRQKSKIELGYFFPQAKLYLLIARLYLSHFQEFWKIRDLQFLEFSDFRDIYGISLNLPILFIQHQNLDGGAITKRILGKNEQSTAAWS